MYVLCIMILRKFKKLELCLLRILNSFLHAICCDTETEILGTKHSLTPVEETKGVYSFFPGLSSEAGIANSCKAPKRVKLCL